MRLILLRHGHDLVGSNGENALSNQGRAQVADTAKKILAAGVGSVDIAYCGESLRAEESLDEVRRHVNVSSAYSTPALKPDNSIDELESICLHAIDSGEDKVVLIVGHEPQMSNALLRWAGAEKPDDSAPRWVLGRGEAMQVSPRVVDGEIVACFDEVVFFGQERTLPTRTKRVGTFG